MAIFLFPVARGPFCAVHGPVTALLSLRLRLKLWLGMALAALHLLGRVLPDSLAALRAAVPTSLLPQSVSPEQIPVLRC